MSAYYAYLNDLMNKNHESFGEIAGIKWLNQYSAADLENKRNEVIKSFNNKVNWSHNNTKTWIKSLSEGCKLCGKGEWSCLFITGRCNANCFYCPTAQNNDDHPTTQQLNFESASDYADYINHLNFKGVSFSGGEPLLSFNKVIDFIKQIRLRCNPDIYIWLYTNGKLINSDKLKQLADLGLNEIRFDIGATNYDITNLKEAAKYIANVTVEIPAIPQEEELLKTLIPDLVHHGVSNLNLHQLRLTQYNAKKLVKHNYTFSRGERPVCVESEFTALNIIQHVSENNINIGVNYCSFPYKFRFQKAGFRTKMNKVFRPKIEISPNGFNYQLYTSKSLNAFNSHIGINDCEAISLEEFKEQLSLLPFIIIEFKSCVLVTSSDNNYEEINIGDIKYNIQDGSPAPPVTIGNTYFDELTKVLYNEPVDHTILSEPVFTVYKYFRIQEGLINYN